MPGYNWSSVCQSPQMPTHRVPPHARGGEVESRESGEGKPKGKQERMEAGGEKWRSPGARKEKQQGD